MAPSTKATLAQLKQVSWFSRVGIQDTESALVLSTWDEAVAHCQDIDWENIKLEAANQFRLQILEQSKERFKLWNEVVADLKQVTIPFVKERIAKVVRADALPKTFEDDVQWDTLHLLAEAEYSDICKPSFYTGQAYWYVKGHFPCGWKFGPPGKGRPIVF